MRAVETQVETLRQLGAPARQDITFALAIPHTPWVPERVESMARLRLELGMVEDGVAFGCEHFRVFAERARNELWSADMWNWGARSGATHFVTLQDDVLVAPGFWEKLRALVTAFPDQVIGLETAHEVAPALCADDVRILTTSDGLIGVGYVLPVPLLEEFLRWRDEQLVDGWRAGGPDGTTALTEDTMVGLWCLATGRRVHHPIPTIIDHDVELASTYGNDSHARRRPTVLWSDAARFEHAWEEVDLEAPAFWRGEFKRLAHKMPDGTYLGHKRAQNMAPEPPRHMGRFYDATPAMARKWVKGFGEAERLKAMRDDGRSEKTRLVYARRARLAGAPRKTLLVCTPVRGGVDPLQARSMHALIRLFEVDVEHGFELLDAWTWQEDLVRVRSRFVRMFLETGADVLHFRDSDVPASPVAILGMLKTDREFIAAPYPRRDGVDWKTLEKGIREGGFDGPLEALAYDFAIDFFEGRTDIDDQDCVDVRSVPLGCSLIKRSLLERMVVFYGDTDRDRVDVEKLLKIAGDDDRHGSRREMQRAIRELARELLRWREGMMGLRFTDFLSGQLHETVALFQIFARGPEGTRPLLSEDAAFCDRVRRLGAKVYLYLGPGSPVDHVGPHVYRGHLEYFGVKRVPTTQATASSAAPRAPASTEPAPAPLGIDPPEDPAREPEEPAVP